MRGTWLLLALAALGCSSTEAPASAPDASVEGGVPWAPGQVVATPRAASVRGLLDRRGLIHAHSVYSHDACDGEPRDDAGAIDEVCFDDFRRDVCRVQHDFVMLTDHRDSFSRTEFPDTLLYRADRGDVLIIRERGPVANRLSCPGGRSVLVLAGCEAGTMPVGLEGHVATPDTRGAIYGATTAEAVTALKSVGAVALVAHTEDWTPERLLELPLDGFEMYNLHANLLANLGGALGIIAQLNQPELLPHPDLILLPVVQEDPRYLATWGTVLARGARRVTTLGTDCHRNSFPQLLPDGERVDSYRRMMSWFSNHLLIRPAPDGSFGDQELKQALRAGRLYGAFEVFGYPEGFDYHAVVSGGTREMGEEVSLAARPELRVRQPTVVGLGPGGTQPEIWVRVLRAREGGWDEVHRASGDVSFQPSQVGAYRAEVRLRPRHLAAHLGSHAELAERDFVWIYSNPIYVVP